MKKLPVLIFAIYAAMTASAGAQEDANVSSVSRYPRTLAGLRLGYKEAVVVAFGTVDVTSGKAVFTVAEVWKGDALTAGTQLTYPGKNRTEIHGVNELFFFWQTPTISSHGMCYTPSDELPIANGKVLGLTMEMLRARLAEEKNQ